ncbi:MAG: ATP-binding cassette domain-containing protein [Halobacteriovoraceae bacterium]|nr:ATP-binding cassette domain-containing protein [Halobacteriovoraceae bacterium]MBT5094503.1 ATP-binding cassette domain-containing protein [Halobacteriovoraceae bacterium]
MIHFNNVTTYLSGKLIIPKLEMKIPAGKTHVLLGSSGCGKTTLLRLIAGLITPREGEVSVDQKPVRSAGLKELTRKLGYVVQDGGLLPHMTAKENILLPVKIHSENLQSAERRLKDLIVMTNFDLALMDSFPSQLSGGQKQRVALMRGLILDPEIILLDEPLSALDPVVRMKLQIQLKKIFEKLKKTVVLVTHDLNVASYLGDTISLMDQGRIVQMGQFQEFIDNPKNKFVKDFVKSQIPSENRELSQ